MQVRHSKEARAVDLDPRIYEVLLKVHIKELQEYVANMALPRHAGTQPNDNGLVRKHIAAMLRGWDYDVQVRGQYFNLLAGPEDTPREPCILIGAHYDSVPETPGADDNASGLAVMLACARILRLFPPRCPVVFAAFNAEEDGALGSSELVASIAAARQLSIKQAHILEMVGYASDRRGSQRPPPGLPARMVPEVGNFLGLVANWHSRQALEGVLRIARTYTPDFPVVGLEMAPAVEKFVPAVQRSDHLPFWRANIPALLWTDTAEYRNPHYHLPSDTPDTLDYTFMSQVLLLLLACILHGDIPSRDSGLIRREGAP